MDSPSRPSPHPAPSGAAPGAVGAVRVSNWIKIGTGLASKPEVRHIARALNVSRNSVVGALVCIWAWFDCNSTDGSCRMVTTEDVDDIAELPGFARAMQVVGWLAYDDTTMTASLPHFERHSFGTEKRRLQKAERSRRYRERQKAKHAEAASRDASRNASRDVQGAPSPSHREENNSSLEAARQITPGVAEKEMGNIRQLLRPARQASVGASPESDQSTTAEAV
ncbi:hypothetical protein LK996_09315 [Lysobacter sp. A6]|uniref:Uncharacterized protein n=1 Tax=Noviluteimonas lactosilytica TaxID=2888523 RepID=A0ABS8JI69_9GAMM|nr:hypothetical protein [Lysobacter lactosilyticus]MCC8363272.1 hypothetical protein [Lysobacter lactosilyticus]